MAHNKPFHRNVRKVVPSPNAGYSSWGYIVDKCYAIEPEHYIRAYMIIQDDLQKLFEYVEPSDACLLAYSYRIHELLMRGCIEVEANCKAILKENTYTQTLGRSGQPIFNIGIYRRIDRTHHLSSYRAKLPIWNGGGRIMQPFASWASGSTPDWYQAYNKSKHDRKDGFQLANLRNVVDAVAGLLVLITSQFGTERFSAGARLMAVEGYDPDDYEPAIGSLFRVKHPSDWIADEMYHFDWSKLKNEAGRFQKIDYDSIE